MRLTTVNESARDASVNRWENFLTVTSLVDSFLASYYCIVLTMSGWNQTSQSQDFDHILSTVEVILV